MSTSKIVCDAIVLWISIQYVFFFQAEDGIRDLVLSRGLGDVYKRQDHHTTAYYRDTAPEITDAQYDALRQHYDSLAAAYPQAVPPDSAAQAVGAAPDSAFGKHLHLVLSLIHIRRCRRRG